MSQRQHPRAKRLETVFKLAEQDEQQTLKNWGQYQQKLDEQLTQRQQLEQYANEYRSRFSADPNHSMSAGYLHHSLDFINKIETGLKAQEEQLNLLTAQTEQAKQVFLDAQAKRKGFEQMLDKLEQEYQQEQARIEQREADEWVNRQAFKANSKSH